MDEAGPSLSYFDLDLSPFIYNTESESDEYEYCYDGYFDSKSGRDTDYSQEGSQLGSSCEDEPSQLQLCLQEGYAYQELLQAGITKLMERLEKNRELQKELRVAQAKPSRRKGPKSRWNWYHSMVFHYPYFRDVHGMPAPLNEDALTKQANQELDPYISPAALWTAEEDRALVDAVKDSLLQQNLEALTDHQEMLAEQLLETNDPERSARLSVQISQLDMEVSKLPSLSLPELLKQSVQPIDWLRIAAKNMRYHRTASGCELRWRHLLDVQLNQDAWTQDEEERLCSLATQRGECNWDKVAEELNTRRSAFQCAQHYFSRHASTRNVGPFSPEERKQLEELIERCTAGGSTSWSKVAHLMGTRNKAQVMSHYYWHLDPHRQQGRWAPEEDMMLLIAVTLYGCEDWNKVASLLLGRTNYQCRKRYFTYFALDINTGPFSPQEDETLAALVEKHGTTHWDQVAKEMPWRSSSSCSSRYRQLVPLLGKDKITVADLKRHNAVSAARGTKAHCGWMSAMEHRMAVYRCICHIISRKKDKQLALELAKGGGCTLKQGACLRLHQQMLRHFQHGASSNSLPKQGKALNKAIAQYAQPLQRSFVPNMAAYEHEEWQAVNNVLHELHSVERPLADPDVDEADTVPLFEEFFHTQVLGTPTGFQVGSSNLPPLLPPNETTVATFGRLVDRFANGTLEDCWSFVQDTTSFPDLSAALNAVNVWSIRCTACTARALGVDTKKHMAPNPGRRACRRCQELREVRNNYDVLCGHFISYFFWPLLLDEQIVIDNVKLPQHIRVKGPKLRRVAGKAKRPWVKAKWAERKRLAAEAAAADLSEEDIA